MYLTIDDLMIGDIVNVYPEVDDGFCEFQGTIVGFKGNLVQVRDQDDDVFDVEPNKLELTKENY